MKPFKHGNRNSIENVGTPGVPNTGRRGEPLPGCDCMRCFGYCMVDPAVAERERALQADMGWQGRRGISAGEANPSDEFNSMWEDR